MAREIGYVVVEYNQASHQPELAEATLHDSKEDALAMANTLLHANRASGRREQFTVGVVTEIEDDE